MNNLNDNISLAIDRIEFNDKNNNYFLSLYPFTTENIASYLEFFDIKDKDVLTVGASGDHILNLLLKEPNSIDYFDINPFVPYYVDLKISSVSSLKRKDFFKYFCNIYPTDYNKDKFSIELYSKIFNNLNEESKIFWNSLYNKYEGIDIRDSRLFSNDEYSYKVLNKINEYLSKKNYLKLSKLEKQNSIFYESNISDLANKLDKKYDLIMLSNIAQYIDRFEEFKRIIFDLKEFLNEDGKILMCYLYGANYLYNENTMPAIYNLKEIQNEIENIDLYCFDSITNLKYHTQSKIEDAVLVYKKTK